MPITTLASLGKSCQSAHQLAHYAEQRPDKATFVKGPFDWLICPPDSLSDWLDAGLPDFDPSEISVHRNHAWWDRYQFWFWHGFYNKTEGEKTLDIEANWQRELAKLNYQREQFNKIDPTSALFVVSNSQNNLDTDVFEADEVQHIHFTANNILRLQASLTNYFGKPVEMQVISRPDRLDDSLFSHPNVSLLPFESSEWKGEPNDWSKALDEIL